MKQEERTPKKQQPITEVTVNKHEQDSADRWIDPEPKRQGLSDLNGERIDIRQLNRHKTLGQVLDNGIARKHYALIEGVLRFVAQYPRIISLLRQHGD